MLALLVMWNMSLQTKNCKRQRQLRWKRWQQSEEAKGDIKQRVELSPEEIAEVCAAVTGAQIVLEGPAPNLNLFLFSASGETQRSTEVTLSRGGRQEVMYLVC